jgi:hypothetical protein
MNGNIWNRAGVNITGACEVEAMRKLLIAAVFVTAPMFGSWPALAGSGYNGAPAPWCAVINLGPSDAYWDCQYASIEQCRPTILAGNRGFCNPNPYFVAQPLPERRRAKHWQQRY